MILLMLLRFFVLRRNNFITWHITIRSITVQPQVAEKLCTPSFLFATRSAIDCGIQQIPVDHTRGKEDEF
jgi:hypothetical protein